MGQLPQFAVRRAWTSYGLWTAGVALRWGANVTGWHWRIGLPVSAALELAGFLTFFSTVSRHKPNPKAPRKPKEPWMLVVVTGTCGFLFALLVNLFATSQAAWMGATPAVPHTLDQRMLAIPVWVFLVPTVWGFNARWLPVFVGLRASNGKQLLTAAGVAWVGVLMALTGHSLVSAILFLAAALLATFALHVFHRPEKAAKTTGVHASFPVFVRIAYGWLAVAGVLTVWAAMADHAGGIWGASRHSGTVGFLGVMVFAIGQRILPAFCGARVLFSKRAMLASLLLLNIGCALRVISEIPAYEGFVYAQVFWRILPVSAITELTAVSLCAANLLVTFSRPPVHLIVTKPQAARRAFA